MYVQFKSCVYGVGFLAILFIYLFFVRKTLLRCRDHLKLCISLMTWLVSSITRSKNTTSLKDLKSKYRDVLVPCC